MPYMPQSFAEYARNLISWKKRKIVWSIISFHLLSSCVCKSLHDFLCACFYGIKGETIEWRSCGFVLSHVQHHMRVFLVCNLLAITRLNSIFNEKDDVDRHPSYKPFCGCYLLLTACANLTLFIGSAWSSLQNIFCSIPFILHSTRVHIEN